MKKLFATIIVASTAAVGFAATPLWMRDVKSRPTDRRLHSATRATSTKLPLLEALPCG